MVHINNNSQSLKYAPWLQLSFCSDDRQKMFFSHTRCLDICIFFHLILIHESLCFAVILVIISYTTLYPPTIEALAGVFSTVNG